MSRRLSSEVELGLLAVFIGVDDGDGESRVSSESSPLGSLTIVLLDGRSVCRLFVSN